MSLVSYLTHWLIAANARRPPPTLVRDWLTTTAAFERHKRQRRRARFKNRQWPCLSKRRTCVWRYHKQQKMMLGNVGECWGMVVLSPRTGKLGEMMCCILVFIMLSMLSCILLLFYICFMLFYMILDGEVQIFFKKNHPPPFLRNIFYPKLPFLAHIF